MIPSEGGRGGWGRGWVFVVGLVPDVALFLITLAAI